MRGHDAPAEAQQVTIVSTNPETLDGLQIYLRGAGLAARCTSKLQDCALAPETTSAFVLFPDDFRWEAVVSMLAELEERYPRAVPVLVTSRPQRFQAVEGAGPCLIVARPAWGWTILEAIRAHRDPQLERSES